MNARTHKGQTALMWACHYGHKEVVQLLLDNSSERNIDLNAKDSYGWTAFIYACKYGRKAVVKLLVEHSKTKGIDISTGQVGLPKRMRRFIALTAFPIFKINKDCT